MSALVNFTSTPIFSSGFSTTTTLPIIPLHHDFRTSTMQGDSPLRGLLRKAPQQSPRQRRERQERVSRQIYLDEERDKRRRSVNIPAYHKPKDARLISAHRHRRIEVHADGSIHTSDINSIFAVFEVVFWCHVGSFVKSCSNSLEKTWLDNNATFSTVLLRYKVSNRYLCVDKKGTYYTHPVPADSANYTNLDDCVFQAAYLLNQYDVYYSRHYPTRTDKCQAGLTTGSDPQTQARTCKNRWYLGVDKKGRVRTVKTPETKLKSNTFFITRWVNEDKGQWLPTQNNGEISPSSPVPSGDKAPQKGGLFEVKPPRKPKSVFSVLFGHKRKFYQNQAETEEETKKRKSGCVNLLKNCDPEVDSRKANHASNFRRNLSTRETRSEMAADQSLQR